MDVMLAPATKLRRVSMLLAFIRSRGGRSRISSSRRRWHIIEMTSSGAAPAPISARLGRRSKILREESERAAPGEIGCWLVVTRRAGVVVEGVLRARVGVDR